MKTLYYRPEGDRKFFSDDVNKVIAYMKEKHKLTVNQAIELTLYGCTQDGKYGIKQFYSK